MGCSYSLFIRCQTSPVHTVILESIFCVCATNDLIPYSDLFAGCMNASQPDNLCVTHTHSLQASIAIALTTSTVATTSSIATGKFTRRLSYMKCSITPCLLSFRLPSRVLPLLSVSLLGTRKLANFVPLLFEWNAHHRFLQFVSVDFISHFLSSPNRTFFVVAVASSAVNSYFSVDALRGKKIRRCSMVVVVVVHIQFNVEVLSIRFQFQR